MILIQKHHNVLDTEKKFTSKSQILALFVQWKTQSYNFSCFAKNQAFKKKI